MAQARKPRPQVRGDWSADDRIPHGTEWAYVGYRCSCERCLRAKREAEKARKEARERLGLGEARRWAKAVTSSS